MQVSLSLVRLYIASLVCIVIVRMLTCPLMLLHLMIRFFRIWLLLVVNSSPRRTVVAFGQHEVRLPGRIHIPWQLTLRCCRTPLPVLAFLVARLKIPMTVAFRAAAQWVLWLNTRLVVTWFRWPVGLVSGIMAGLLAIALAIRIELLMVHMLGLEAIRRVLIMTVLWLAARNLVNWVRSDLGRILTVSMMRLVGRILLEASIEALAKFLVPALRRNRMLPWVSLVRIRRVTLGLSGFTIRLVVLSRAIRYLWRCSVLITLTLTQLLLTIMVWFSFVLMIVPT